MFKSYLPESKFQGICFMFYDIQFVQNVKVERYHFSKFMTSSECNKTRFVFRVKDLSLENNQ